MESSSFALSPPERLQQAVNAFKAAYVTKYASTDDETKEMPTKFWFQCPFTEKPFEPRPHQLVLLVLGCLVDGSTMVAEKNNPKPSWRPLAEVETLRIWLREREEAIAKDEEGLKLVREEIVGKRGSKEDLPPECFLTGDDCEL